MTHFSDFSYLARGVADFFVLMWSIMHIYSIDRFDALRWKGLKRLEVKSIMTIFFLLSVTCLLVYDIMCTKIKYSEGFVVDPITKAIIAKPEENWSPENKKLRHIANRILMLFYAIENSAVFLLQNFWNYLANKIVKSSFITTWQFRVNYAFIVITFILFNCLPIFCENDDDGETLDYSNPEKIREAIKKHTYEEVIPQLAAACCNLIVLFYAIMAHFKFSSLIKKNNQNYIVDRLRYYKYMNLLLLIIVAFGCALMITLCVDALSDEKYLNRNKFTLDLFIGTLNFFTAAFWIVWLKIFYPRLLPTTYSSKHFSKLSSPVATPTYPTTPTFPTTPTSEFSTLNGRKDKAGHKIPFKQIEIKVDSTTTTKTNQYNNNNNSSNYDSYYNSNEKYNNVQNDGYVQPPLPLATNNKQIISYTGSPKQYQNFV